MTVSMPVIGFNFQRSKAAYVTATSFTLHHLVTESSKMARLSVLMASISGRNI